VTYDLANGMPVQMRFIRVAADKISTDFQYRAVSLQQLSFSSNDQVEPCVTGFQSARQDETGSWLMTSLA